MLERLIFHIDVNSAFLSWTSVKRLSEGKSNLRLIPAVIGGAPRTGGQVLFWLNPSLRKNSISTPANLCLLLLKMKKQMRKKRMGKRLWT
ncbi:MAG: hypothetical protein II044_07590 [Lachnospiraceae bacterium]|jgi:DNA polymerase-4|nr:hypothetical protein [Lachnospiraceae bacterium]MEE3357684.1 hypothetical protein [Lachnospiraceae bacterium]